MGQTGNATVATHHESKPNPANTTTSISLTLQRPSTIHLPAKARDIDRIQPALRDAIRGCVGGSSRWPLFVFGPAGTGKSCAALCLCDRVPGSLFWTEEQLCQTIVEAMMDRLTNSLGYPVTPQQIWSKASRSPLVALDELGARTTVSDHRYSVVKSVLDAREGKPLMIVSNLAKEEIATVYDDRIASRALCGTIVKLGGTDRRRPR